MLQVFLRTGSGAAATIVFLLMLLSNGLVSSTFAFVSPTSTIHGRSQRISCHCRVPSTRKTPGSASQRYILPKPFTVHPTSSTTIFSSASNPFLHSAIKISPMTTTLGMTIRAFLALCGSAFCGMSYGGGGGTLVTILVAAHLSNLNLSPPSHVLYEFCWTHALPASLVLLLLSPPTEEQERHDDSTMMDVVAVFIPFVVGSIGSVLGCAISFWACLWGANHHTVLLGKCLLAPREALVTAGCVCASFIGGPYNFFAAARIVSAHSMLGHDGGMLSSLLGASAADLLVTAIYYAILTSCVSSKRLQRWFPGRKVRGPTRSDNETQALPGEQPRNDARGISLISAKRRILPAAFISTGVALVAVSISQSCDRLLVGTECACLVALGALLSRLLPRLLGNSRRNLLANVDSCSTIMSEYCFHLLLAAIGSSANLREAVRQGGWHSVSSFGFSALAQLVHLIVILAGSLGISKVLFPLGIDEILVASNAAIGGPVTAATFAGQEIPNRRGLVVAATVWGVLGYAVGTRIGVGLTQSLTPLLR